MLLLWGCTKHSEQAIDTSPDLPPPLQKMQGTWQTEDTTAQCTAIFQLHTVRIRYQSQASEQLYKRNASIERVDAVRNQLIINGGTGSWPYRFSYENGEEQLALEFFTEEGWRHIKLKRKET
jgi:hypothetical protein